MKENMFKHKLFVRYFETDQMGVVYYSHYLVWFEAARTDMLKTRGLSYKEFEKMGYFLPVAEAHCKYIVPAHYEEDIIVETWIEEIKRASVRISYNVVREEDGKCLAVGYTVHPCINKDRKIVAFPEEFVKIFTKC